MSTSRPARFLRLAYGDRRGGRAVLKTIFVWSALTLAITASPVAGQPATSDIGVASRNALGSGVTKAVLTNGLVVLVRENPGSPAASVRCYVKNTGSAFEGKYLGGGLSHLLEHLLAVGHTTKRSEAEIQQQLDALGGQSNAFTSGELTAFHIDCAAEHVPVAIELIADNMQHATMPDEQFARELGVVQRELEMGQANPQGVLFNTMKSLVYTEHPLRHPTVGYLPVVRRVTRDQVFEFYRERYVPQNLVFVVVGPVTANRVFESVLANFAGSERTTERSVTLPIEPLQAAPRNTRRELPGETSRYGIAWPTVAWQHADAAPLEVVSYLLTHGDGSRLGRRLKSERPLAISVSSFVYAPGFAPGWLQITVECRPENLDTCREIIAEEVARLQQQLPSPDEVLKAGRQKAAQVAFEQETVKAQAHSLARSYLSTGDPLFERHYLQAICGVTAQRVGEVAQLYLVPARQNTVTIDPPETRRPEAVAAALENESPVVRHRLNNGLTVLLKRDSTNPLVSIQAVALAGTLSDSPETAGLAALASTMMSRGTRKYAAQQIVDHFDSVGGELTMRSQNSTSQLDCRVLKDDLTVALDYVYQVLWEPTFPANEFAKVQQQQLARIAARQADPQTEILDFWTRQLSPQSPYGRPALGWPETVDKLRGEDCRRFHARYFVPNNVVLAIYGDFDPQPTLARLEDSFGRTPWVADWQSPPFPEEHLPATASSAHLPTRRENTAMVLISFPTVNERDTNTRAAIEIFNTYLTGGGSGGRLFDELRGAQLVYYVMGAEVTGPSPGYFLFLAQTRPETVEEVVSRILAAVERLGSEPLSPDEFARVLGKTLAARALRSPALTAQAGQAAIDERGGLGYDHDETFREQLRAITADDLQEVVRRYFQEPFIVTSSSMPSVGVEKTTNKE